MEPNMQSHLSIFNPSFCMVSFYLLPTSCMTSSSYIYSISHPHYSVLQLTKTFVVETSCCVINLLRHLLKKSVLIQKCAYSKVWICWLVTRLVREAEYTHHKWGCAHDKGVLTAYQHQQETHHRTLKVSSSGFVKSTENLHVGASPDGIINCDCCWRRILEVKCPFSCVCF